MFCPKCGNQVQDGAAFCSQCGFRFSEGKANLSSQSDIRKIQEYIVNNKKTIGIAFAALIIVLIIIKVLSGGGNSQSGGFSSYEKAAEGFIAAMEAQDKQQYLECFPKEMRANISEGIERQLALEQTGGNRDFDSPYRFFLVTDENISYTVLNYEDMDQDDIELYNDKYGYKAKEGQTVNMEMSVSYPFMGGTATRSSNFSIPVGKIGKKWFVLEPSSIRWVWGHN